MEDTTLEFIITAQNQAKEAFREVESQLSGMQKTMNEVANNSETANKKMSQSVFSGVAAWDLLKEGVGMATEFAVSSVNRYLDSSVKIDLARANIEATGLSWETAGKQLEEFGSKMAMMGTNSEDAILSAAKLTKASGDITQGFKLAKLAADLTASGFGSLEQNTSNLTAILAGKGSLAARTYRLNLSETATTAEILQAVQKKVTQTAEDFGNTIPGKIKAVKAVVDDLQQAVGEGLTQALLDVTGAGNKANTAMEKMQKNQDNVRKFVYTTASSLGVLVSIINLLVVSLADVGNTLTALAYLMSGDFKKATELLDASADNVANSMIGVKDAIAALLKPIDNFNSSLQVNSDSSIEAGNNLDDFGSILNKQKVSVDDFTKAVKSTNDELRKMARDFAQTQADTIQEGKNKIVDYVAESMGENEKAKHKIEMNESLITDLVASHASARTKAEHDAINARIVDLRNETLALQDEVAVRELKVNYYYNKYSQWQQEINDRSKYFAADEITRIEMDTKTKLLENQKEYLQKQINLYQDLLEKKKAADEEVDIERKTVEQKKGIIADFSIAVKKELDIQKQAVVDWCRETKSQYSLWADSVKSYISSVNSKKSSLGFSSAYAITRASGGSVSANEPYFVGEAGPELFVPKQSGTIIPNFGLVNRNPSPVVVNINGGYFLSREVGRELADVIMKELKRTQKL